MPAAVGPGDGCWDRSARLAAAAADRVGRPRPAGGGGGMGGGWMGGMLGAGPATPELLAQGRRAAAGHRTAPGDPAGHPEVQPRTHAAAGAGLLIVALMLVALDAVASLMLPVLIRYGVDNGVSAGSAAVVMGGVRCRAGRGRRRLPDPAVPDAGRRARRRERAVPAAAAGVRPPATARPGLLRARDGRPDHDPDDHGRRRTVQLPADRPGDIGGLPGHLRRDCRRPAGDGPRVWR